DHDELVITARPPGEPWPDFTGSRDIVFWDGSGFELIWQSPGPWYGRPELNNNGVIVFEGFGGLVGSTSSGRDTEIFVYDPAVGVVVQITDDDDADIWPEITDDGTIYWSGHGRYPSAVASGSDREIFRAIPDSAPPEPIPVLRGWALCLLAGLLVASCAVSRTR
ncbi:MAG: hypothetical protein JRG76_19000, partial [Deltaproteobacteria bacterium]|nr:hypothetical protein [Deltaproteobacteria bacterium]